MKDSIFYNTAYAALKQEIAQIEARNGEYMNERKTGAFKASRR